MTDPRAELHAIRSRTLRVRSHVRAIAATLRAAEHAFAGDERRGGDRQPSALRDALAAERDAVAQLGAELDARLDRLDVACRALEANAAARTIAGARRRRRAPDATPA